MEIKPSYKALKGFWLKDPEDLHQSQLQDHQNHPQDHQNHLQNPAYKKPPLGGCLLGLFWRWFWWSWSWF